MSTTQHLTVQQNLAIRLLRVLRYNKARSERAVELLPESKKPLFQVLPFLLHINHPEFPGFVDDDETPFGLNNYSLREQLKLALNQTFPRNKVLLKDMKQLWPKDKLIDSLVLMGSIGTIAQSKSSDFDYWVCIDSELFSERAKELLQQKLNLIEQWAEHTHALEVHFFLSEIENVRNNDFGVAEGESAGSAQAIFLKGEFYTTNIVVAGKAPFWWLMPDKTSDQQYTEIIEALKAGEHPDPKWFMDLGNLTKMDSRELFGAAIWQIIKGMDSPFKSVLKMAKLEVFLETIEHQQPLCNLLKKRVHNGSHAPGNLEFIDPYALMFDELIEFYTRAEKPEIVELLQLCLYIKCDCQLSLPARKEDLNFKRHIISSYVEKWNWSVNKLNKVDRLKYWDFRDLLKLSRQIHAFLINCYRRMSVKLADEEQSVSQEDMTVLGRKIDTYYSKKPNKVEYLRSAFDNELYCDIITIKAELKANHKKKWSMYAGNQLDWEDSAPEKVHLYSSFSPVDLVVWGVRNRILDSKTIVLLGYQTETLCEKDLNKLILNCEKMFPPIKVSEIPRDDMLLPSRITHCLAVANFESRKLKPEIETLQVIYSNTWGELYNLNGVQALRELRYDLNDVKPLPVTALMLPDESHAKRLIEDFFKKTEMKFSHHI